VPPRRRAGPCRAEAGCHVEPGELRDVGGDGRREDLLGPGHRLEALEGPDHDGDVGGDGRGPFDVATVSGPAEGGAEVGELGVRPVERAALVGTVPDVPLQQDLLGEVAAVPVPHVGERAGAGELVLGELRIVSRTPYRVEPPTCSVVTRDFRTRQSSRSSVVYSSSHPSTAAMAARSQPSANTEQHPRTRRSSSSSRS
jgi:hypothetical protein